MEKLNNLELALIDEIDMVIESYYGENKECNLTEEDKLSVARHIIDYEDYIWEALNRTIIETIERKLDIKSKE